MWSAKEYQSCEISTSQVSEVRLLCSQQWSCCDIMVKGVKLYSEIATRKLLIHP